MNSFLRSISSSLIIALLLTCALSPRLWAFTDLHVVALFKDRVVVMIDGKQRLLRSGETSPEGVKLLSADSGVAVFDYRGEMLERRLDGRVRSAVNSAATVDEVQIFRNTNGMYQTVGSINGLPVGFLVDTGASSIAMNSTEARRLGIDYRVVGEPTYVSTASDIKQAFSLKLQVVKVGGIQLQNVDALVMEGTLPTQVLLGMSFLQRLEMVNQGERMILRKKY